MHHLDLFSQTPFWKAEWISFRDWPHKVTFHDSYSSLNPNTSSNVFTLASVVFSPIALWPSYSTCSSSLARLGDNLVGFLDCFWAFISFFPLQKYLFVVHSEFCPTLSSVPSYFFSLALSAYSLGFLTLIRLIDCLYFFLFLLCFFLSFPSPAPILFWVLFSP